jgi:pimeloyl-ACP methyl ester carboxylesterase
MRVSNDGVTVDYEVHGSGDAVLLLHGFPDSRALWRHQVAPLVDAGYSVLVPDLRGYGLSDQPQDVHAYHVFALVGDAVAILDQQGVGVAHVVGHDWGAALAWALAISVPDRVRTLTALSVGHPSEFFAEGYLQHEKSWYMLLFQYPGIAERWLSDDGWANFRAWSRHPEADAVIAALEATGSLTPALNYYRSTMTPEVVASGPISGLPLVSVPTMGVWGSEDMALTEGQMVRSRRQVAGPWRYERIDGAGHWLTLEVPDRITELLVDFLGSS